jgi:Inner membrane component of T3SS, cytoplasmic domain
MSNGDNKDTIKITLDDLAKVNLEQVLPGPITAPAAGSRSYGTITDASEQGPIPKEERGSILLQGWFYLGLSGLLGAAAGWALAEPGFVDSHVAGERHWGNFWIIPIIVTLMCLGFAVAESTVERSAKKALLRGVLALPLGIFLGFVFDFIAETVFSVLVSISVDLGVHSFRNPAFWIARGLAWTAFGAAGGVIYGIIGQSSKKATYGVIGGMIGAGLGGLIFDPIAIVSHGGAVSRAVGFALVGLSTGVGMGLVESALKDRWLYVTAGPLAGKQFILYKPRTIIGSRQDCDIYLFKDANILPEHATLELAGARVQLRATGPVLLAGSSIQSRVLQDNDLLQIGRYTFRYKEKHRA